VEQIVSELRNVYLIYLCMGKFLCCRLSVHDSFQSNHKSFICASSYCKKCFMLYSNLREYQYMCMLVMLIHLNEHAMVKLHALALPLYKASWEFRF